MDTLTDLQLTLNKIINHFGYFILGTNYLRKIGEISIFQNDIKFVIVAEATEEDAQKESDFLNFSFVNKNVKKHWYKCITD